jgi:hypothetical protein
VRRWDEGSAYLQTGAQQSEGVKQEVTIVGNQQAVDGRCFGLARRTRGVAGRSMFVCFGGLDWVRWTGLSRHDGRRRVSQSCEGGRDKGRVRARRQTAVGKASGGVVAAWAADCDAQGRRLD